MKFAQKAKQIITLKNKDLAFRDQLIKKGELHFGYHPEMEELHLENAALLVEIMDEIGYPTTEKVGRKGSEAAWLIIQHAISNPVFMKKCAAMLEKAVELEKGNPIQLAYLTDRIAVLENREQKYGTQFDWDKSGKMSPEPYDNLEKVNKRRAVLGLNTLEAQTALIRQRVKAESQLPPQDWKVRKAKMMVWKKAVGWIK